MLFIDVLMVFMDIYFKKFATSLFQNHDGLQFSLFSDLL